MCVLPKFSLLAGVLALAAVAVPAVAQPQRARAQQYEFDRAAFDTSLRGKLDGTVKGWSYVLMRDGRIVSEAAGGLARNAADGSMRMTTSTPVNIGSLFKFVSGVSLMQALEKRPTGSAGGSGDIDTALDVQMRLLLPAFWTREIASQGVSGITIRRLLQHRTGLNGGTEDIVREFRKVRPGPFRPSRNYENINFGLVGYVLGGYVKPSLVSALNQESRSANNPNDMLFSERALGAAMDGYIRFNVMGLVPGGPVPSCDAANEFRATAAYAYRSKDDRARGIVTSRMAEGKPCIGAGGYWMSARHLAAFASAAAHGNQLLSAKARGLMFAADGRMDDRLVWSSADTSDWVRDNFGEPHVVASDGYQPYAGGQGTGGVLLRLPDKHVLVILRNSTEWSSGELQAFGYQAFVAGMKDNFD